MSSRTLWRVASGSIAIDLPGHGKSDWDARAKHAGGAGWRVH